MKKLLTLFLVISIILYLWYIFTVPLLNDDEALIVGEEKYLSFLWIVDGVFSDKEYFVNNKTLNNKFIQCEYHDKKCLLRDFNNAFNNLFSQNIDYQQVYGDNISFSLIDDDENEFVFKNNNFCNNREMDLHHTISVISSKRGKIIYRVLFTDSKTENAPEREYEKTFTLVYEDKNWKIKEAYYHDKCHMDYNIYVREKKK